MFTVANIILCLVWLEIIYVRFGLGLGKHPGLYINRLKGELCIANKDQYISLTDWIDWKLKEVLTDEREIEEEEEEDERRSDRQENLCVLCSDNWMVSIGEKMYIMII